jgi:hydrogenase maturation factor
MCLGRIGTVTKTWDEGGVPMALVRTHPDAEPEEACCMAVPDVWAGMRVLVHLGFVIEVLSADRAAEAEALRSTEATAEGSGRR